VNLGQLGYLTQVEPTGVFVALQGFFDGQAVIEERMMLAIEHRRGERVQRVLALNELVIEKSEPGHTVRMRVAIDGEDFTSYAADALIVATPTGSTAYSLSVRGPIVSPSHRAMVLSPVAPHMLFDRSLVLGPEQRLDISIVGHRLAEMTIDGTPMARLEPDDVITCTASDTSARFVRNGALPFHQILKAKFGLADR
jgi:NAD+ kinase